MVSWARKVDFFATEEGVKIKRELLAMFHSKQYHTPSTYCVNTELYPDNLMPFVDRHMEYIRAHPTTNPTHYLSNLRLMTRVPGL